MPFDEQTKKKFIDTFVKRLRDIGGEDAGKCPLCTNSAWSTVDGYVVPSVQPELGGLHVGGPSLPTIPIVCNNCGFVAHISLGILGLLPAKDEVEEANS